MHKHKQHEYHLAHHYKISIEQKQAMLTVSDNRCVICDTEFTEETPAVIDHAQACCPGAVSCGKCVRGVICNRCNLMIGQARESVEVLMNAAKYLEYAVLPNPALSLAPSYTPNGKGRQFSKQHKLNLSIAKKVAVQNGTWVNPKTGVKL